MCYVLLALGSGASAATCNVGQCFSTKNNPSCPAGWQSVPGSCTTVYGAGICCAENKDPNQGPLVDTTGGSNPAAQPAASSKGAAAPAPGGMTNLPCEATGDCEIKDLVAKAVMFAQFLMGLAGALFLFAFVYGGAMYILAFGRSSYIDKGKKAMIQAAIGMALIMGAWTIVTYLVSSLGAKI